MTGAESTRMKYQRPLADSVEYIACGSVAARSGLLSTGMLIQATRP